MFCDGNSIIPTYIGYIWTADSNHGNDENAVNSMNSRYMSNGNMIA